MNLPPEMKRDLQEDFAISEHHLHQAWMYTWYKIKQQPLTKERFFQILKNYKMTQGEENWDDLNFGLKE